MVATPREFRPNIRQSGNTRTRVCDTTRSANTHAHGPPTHLGGQLVKELAIVRTRYTMFTNTHTLLIHSQEPWATHLGGQLVEELTIVRHDDHGHLLQGLMGGVY